MKQRGWRTIVQLAFYIVNLARHGVKATAPAIRLAVTLPFALWNDSGSSMTERALWGAQMAAEEITARPDLWFGSVPFQVDAIDDALPTAEDYGVLINQVQRQVIQDVHNGYNGVLGDRYSTASEMVSYSLAVSGIFQCSIWSTSPNLGDKKSFPTFFRLVADDNFQALVILDLVRSQSWTKIGVLVGDESYGQGLLDKVRDSVSSYGISLLASYTYYMDDPDGIDYRVKQLKALGARIILLFPNGEADAIPVLRILNSNGMTGADYAYIGGDNLLEVYSKAETDEDRENLRGLLMTEPLEYSSLTKPFEAAFLSRWSEAPPSGAVAWYDATYAFAYAFKNLMQQYSYTPEQIANNTWLEKRLNVTQFTNFSFVGAMGRAAWMANGDSVNALFHVNNLVNGSWVEVARGQAGALNITAPILFAGGLDVRPADSPKLADQTIGYQKIGPAIIIALTSIELVAVAGSIIPLAILRDHPMLKPVSPIFMSFSAVGMVLCLLSIFVDALKVPTTISCNSYMSLLGVGFGMVVGGILVKLRRLHKIFDNRAVYRRSFPNSQLLAQSGLIVLGELVFIFIWAGAFPLLSVEHDDLEESMHYYVCATSNQKAGEAMMLSVLVYNALLVLACCYLAFATRNIFSNYNEAKSIGVAIYNIAFCCIIILLTTYLTSIAPIPAFIIRSACVLLAVAVTYAALCGRILYAVVTKTKGDYLPAVGGPTGVHSGDDPISRAKAENKSALLVAGCKQGLLAVRGSSRVTSNRQWRNFNLSVMIKPSQMIVLINEREPDVGLALSLKQVHVEAEGDRFKLTWPKGELEFQASSEADALGWVGAINDFARDNAGAAVASREVAKTAMLRGNSSAL
ncbi:hypothetical protein HKX48_001374 [Thoreauomyces humboldtii]|nr:hypothetical protein HKX48_001374 [Thoreauomyces humboldtii]